ncbi:MAG: Hsp20/alpha crystallin family protein, partial [Bacteroidota bacterium]
MPTFTAFRGISPQNSRSRHIDDVFDYRRRRLFGDTSIRPEHEMSIPTANVTEYDEADKVGYLIELAAPGYEKSDFNVEVHDDVLTISGQLEENRTRGQDSFRSREYNYNNFSRSWSLPESFDEDNITANYRNGILEVFIPVQVDVEETKEPR